MSQPCNGCSSTLRAYKDHAGWLMEPMRAGLCLLLAVVYTVFTLGSSAQARFEAKQAVLYQVAPHTWNHAIPTWARHLNHSWTVRQGVLTNTGKGRKVCDSDE